MKRVVLLGSTGSIGKQALAVIKAQGFGLQALSANRNVAAMEAQVRAFAPAAAVMADAQAAADLRVRVADTNTKVSAGEAAICEMAASPQSDIILNAIVGIAGLRPSLSALQAKKPLALANKETLVTAGPLVMETARRQGVPVLPVDSEHSAIFQCLQGVPAGALSRILLTASGGPFYGKKRSQLAGVTPEQALRHPNWDMGAKITIDSSTMMNKGLEVLEAMYLFGVGVEQIEVIVHRESILHSAVELVDGSVLAQCSLADMRLPIQYALTWPARESGEVGRLSLTQIGSLHFAPPDLETFTCLKTCLAAARAGGLVPAAVNGANEEAVGLFLQGRIPFLKIGELVEKAASLQPKVNRYSVEDVFACDQWARRLVRSSIS